MNKTAHRIYLFDDFSLDLTRGSLTRDSEEIKLRPKSFEVLEYLAENPGRLIGKEELISAVWQETAVTDDSLVQCMREVRKALNDDTQSIIKTLPRRGYVFQKEVREIGGGFYSEESLDLRVVIEETIETNGTGDTASSLSVIEQPKSTFVKRLASAVRRHPGRSVSALILITVLTSTGIFYKPILAWYIKPPSIAVLPVVNSTGNPELEYISDGLTDSIIHSLNQLNEPRGKSPRLRVTGLNVAMIFKNKEGDPRETGQKLGVDTVLASKMTEENGLRVFKFELINVTDGSIRWNRQYAFTVNRPAEFLEKQNEIPGDLAAHLPISLSDGDRQNLTRRYTQNADAYDAYLKGRLVGRFITPSTLRKSIEDFQQAIDLDPGFALPYWAMGMAYRNQGLIDERSDKDANDRAVDLFQKALKIDSTLTVAYDGMRVSDAAAGKWESIKKAGPTHPAYAQYLVAAGRLDELIELENQRLSVNPYVPILNFSHCGTLLGARRYPEAIAQCQKTLNLAPSADKADFGPRSPWTHLLLANIYGEQGDFDNAIGEAKVTVDLAEQSEAMLAVLGYIYAKAGRKEEAREVLDLLNGQIAKGEYVPALNVAWIYVFLGDNDNAFACLEKAFEEGEDRLKGIKTGASYDPLRSDPRFAAFVQRLAYPN